MHDLGINQNNYLLNINNTATQLHHLHGIGIFITSNPLHLASALTHHANLEYKLTLTFHFSKVAYTSDHLAPPHVSGFFVVLFCHTDCPFNTIWVPSPPIGAPYYYLSHIPLPPANKDNIKPIPASLALMAENKVLLHPCFYSFLLTSIDFPATTEDHIHTVYDTQPTYNMLLPISIVMNYWYLLLFTNKASNFEYPPKDYVTWAMHFLA
ncbi:uncharacterized protein ACA1_106830 [Acanthamoeba castellanii str. Neff]|uniref:Uncharacterized protein n=1 Tax=Acanthamoeba castellanii (strain ATCC 30010 / Neff) TaxID=1257118 RepID=L8GMV3_ACACF|nr:uncharacterized protein ACA1_106830 [Acanthamoeba castellanii str. Neff]ELR14312.1 hypothetical protein ACA1_106830 [Acanthamoeba castellanii str. Neff]